MNADTGRGDTTAHPEDARPDDVADRYADVKLPRQRSALEAGRAHLFYTGRGRNLLTRRPEIRTLLLVSDPNWRRQEVIAASACGRPWKLAWEWRSRKDEHQLAPRVADIDSG